MSQLQLSALILNSSASLPGAFWIYLLNSKDFNRTTSIAKVCRGQRKANGVQICAQDVSGSGEIRGVGSEEGIEIESTAIPAVPSSQ